MVVHGRDVQWSVTLIRPLHMIASARKQEPNQLQIPFLAGLVQGRPAINILDVNISATIQQ